MKSKKIFITFLALSLAACAKRNDSRPAAPAAQPTPPVSAPIPTPAPAQPSVDAVAAQTQFTKAQELLVSMNLKVNGKDIVIPSEPTTYKQTKDLKMALDSYRSAAQQMVNLSRSPEQKQVYQGIVESSTYLSNKYAVNLQRFYLEDLQRIGLLESRLSAVGFIRKKVNGNPVLALDKSYYGFYPRSEQKHDLVKYIEALEAFLEAYSDGQSHLDFETKVNIEKKLELSKDLAATLN